MALLILLITETPLFAAEERESSPIKTGYNRSKGWILETGDGNTSLWFGVRLQLRATTLKGDPVEPERLESLSSSDLAINRGRLKLGGHIFRPWLQIYSEYDFYKTWLLDYRITFNIRDWLHVRGGQWKSEFSRERIDSSGKQELVDRSIANYWFTLDRQLGVSMFGRFGAGQRYDSSYWLEVLSGNGRGGGWDRNEALYLARYQWNVLGRVLPFSQSDITRRDPAAASIALAGVYGDTRYTRFSSSGGGQLPGYEAGDDGKYRLSQVLLETAYQRKGLAWQHELHWKEIEDRKNNTTRNLWGGYLQLGYFFHELWPAIPAPLELAGRFGLVDPDTSLDANLQQEWTLGANWFFEGHRNKITLDVSQLILDAPDGEQSETRVRAQWDVSF
jgi:phosphate-selective porin